MARIRSLIDNGCWWQYNSNPSSVPYGTTSTTTCSPNHFTSGYISSTPYFADVPSTDNYFNYIQRMGDLGAYSNVYSPVPYPGCGGCTFSETATMTRGNAALELVTAAGIDPRVTLTFNSNIGPPSGPNYATTLPTITVPFNYYFQDKAHGANDVAWAQFALADSSGTYWCYGDWGQPQALDLYDGSTGVTDGFNTDQADSFCTVSLASITNSTTDPTAVTVLLSFTFNPGYAGTYTVMSQMDYATGYGTPAFENIGTVTIQTPTALNPSPTVVLTDNNPQFDGTYMDGDSFTLTVTGPSGLPVSATINGVDYGVVGQTPYTTTNQWNVYSSGAFTSVWYVDGVAATPNPLTFTVVAPPPSGYSDYLNSPVPATPACNITGSWADTTPGVGYPTATWSLSQPNNSTISGSLSVSATCGTNIWTNVTGMFAAGVASLTAGSPQNAFDGCGSPWATTVTADVTFASCIFGATTDVAYIPAYTNQFGGYQGAYTNTGSGSWSLATQPLTFSVNPSPVILLSTGDTNVPITTTASLGSYNIQSPSYYLPFGTTNPGSAIPPVSANAGLTFPSNASGTGSASGYLLASPSANSGSGIYPVAAAVGATTTGNVTTVVIPPLVLMQGMYGEAHSQAQVYGPSDPTEEALGVTIRNRLGDQGFAANSSYVGLISPGQIQGLNTSLTSWTNSDGSPKIELAHAANVFDGSSTVTVANSECFFSPTNNLTTVGWAAIQAALASGTATIPPSIKFDPKCFGVNRQIIYKTSISPNANGSGAPAFVFEQYRADLSAPAVIQIP